MARSSRIASLFADLTSATLRSTSNASASSVLSQLNAGAEAEVLAAAEERLKLSFPPPLREFYSLADGQKPGTGLLLVPKNRSLKFLSLSEARNLWLYWKESADRPHQQRYWKEAGYDPSWIPIGFDQKLQISLCVSSRVGRMVRFTTPEAAASLTAVATDHLAENLEDYLADLTDYYHKRSAPFGAGGKSSSTEPESLRRAADLSRL
eukprot:TRINITY_DN93050_c0_g1_i1.p1 TRINITY_DN93050_c0_g1~~TRINITY_DN93050_c0_g1_i1.p1  ORF type:complete len:208 (-),score=38.38 TRINITY_DN93050_c0_g1_i1:242-865(-)